jgi:hypothetical protein
MKEMSAMKKIVIGILTLGLFFGIGGMTFADELADILHPVDPKSELPMMTDTELKDVIEDAGDVKFEKSLVPFTRAVFKHDDETEILKLVEEYGKYWFLAFIEKDVPIPDEMTRDKGLLEELNARQKYYFTHNFDVNATSYKMDLSLEDVMVKDGMAKVIINRSLKFQKKFNDSAHPVDVAFGQSEGYILEKVDGKWYFNNIIFDTDSLPSRILESLAKTSDPKEWKEKFSFAVLPRKAYEVRNFTEEIRGEKKLET